MNRRALWFGLVGAGAGVMAAITSSLLMPRLTLENTMVSQSAGTVDFKIFTWYDKPYGIAGHILLGILVSGIIAMMSIRANDPGRKLRAFLIAAPLAAALCWAGAYCSDTVGLKLIRAQTGGSTIVELGKTDLASNISGLLWYAMVALGLTLPIFLAAGANLFLFVRSLIGAVLAFAFGLLISNVIFTMMVPAIFASVLMSGSPQNIDIITFVKPIYIGLLLGMGAGSGIAFAVADAIWKPAWLRSFSGATEGRTWTLGAPIARIGIVEGLEVKLPSDGLTAPVHAQIQSNDDGHLLMDLVGSTSVNGVVQPASWLKDGDKIGIGSHALIYRTRLAPTGKAIAAQEPRPLAAPQPLSNLTEPRFVLVDRFGRDFEIRQGVQILGREEGCDLVFYDSSVSRRHAELTWSGNRITVRDLGSSNGTYLNDNPFSGTQVLQAGDILRLGGCPLILQEKKPATTLT